MNISGKATTGDYKGTGLLIMGLMPELIDFDKLWDYQDPAATESAFRALYNNLGESYAKLGQHEAALDAFRKLAALDRDQGRLPELFTIKDQSRMLRLLGRVDEAIATLQPAIDRLAREQKRDGWISEEHAC
jgi:tetratricopeptide (TPR) repeat protein